MWTVMALTVTVLPVLLSTCTAPPSHADDEADLARSAGRPWSGGGGERFALEVVDVEADTRRDLDHHKVGDHQSGDEVEVGGVGKRIEVWPNRKKARRSRIRHG